MLFRSARATKLLVSTPDETASLVSLVPSAGSLVPAFSSELSSYRLLVPGSATAAATVSFTATSADPRWEVLANGTELKSGTSTRVFSVGEIADSVKFEVKGISAPSSYAPAGLRIDACLAMLLLGALAAMLVRHLLAQREAADEGADEGAEGEADEADCAAPP